MKQIQNRLEKFNSDDSHISFEKENGSASIIITDRSGMPHKVVLFPDEVNELAYWMDKNFILSIVPNFQALKDHEAMVKTAENYKAMNDHSIERMAELHKIIHKLIDVSLTLVDAAEKASVEFDDDIDSGVAFQKLAEGIAICKKHIELAKDDIS